VSPDAPDPVRADASSSAEPSQVPDPPAERDGMDVPTWSDGFVAAVSHRVGGPVGRRFAPSRSWLTPAAVALLTATVVWALGALQKVPCRVTQAGQGVDWFARLCYSDIPLLFRGRGLAEGNTPFLDSGSYPVLEYPVLTGALLEVERWITVLLGYRPTTDEQGQITASVVFFDVNVVVLFCFLAVGVVAQVRTTQGRPWDAMMVAASPLLIATGLINWDLMPVALTALGCMFWARRRPGWAGVLWGLGMAAKLYPLFLLGPLLILGLRARRMRELGTCLLTFAGSWLVVNLPVMILAPEQWLGFWTFNDDRGADLGSIWYVLSLAGTEVSQLNTVSMAVFMIMCGLIGGLIVLSPRRPRFGQVAFLVLFAFLVTNKVYSPQYQLWLLPFLALARPRWRDWWIFTIGEIVYVLGIWGHLGGFLSPGNGGPDRLYWLSVLVRIGCESWIVIMIVRDVLRPAYDPVRTPGMDDPSGGVLDHAPDAPWVSRLWLRDPAEVGVGGDAGFDRRSPSGSLAQPALTSVESAERAAGRGERSDGRDHRQPTDHLDHGDHPTRG